MRLMIFPDAEALALALAEGLAALLRAQPKATLILPSGRTPELAYAHLARWVAQGQLDPSGATAFALDEVLGLGPQDESSFAHYHARHVWGPWGLAPEACFVPDGLCEDPALEARRYAEALRAQPQPALSLLGLGANAHVAFNEPAPHHPAEAGVVALAPATAGGAAWGITLGLAAIGSAEALWVAATGAHKAQAVQAMLEGPLDPQCPASLLRVHPRLTVLLDPEAASGLGPETLARAIAPSLP